MLTMILSVEKLVVWCFMLFPIPFAQFSLSPTEPSPHFNELERVRATLHWT